MRPTTNTRRGPPTFMHGLPGMAYHSSSRSPDVSLMERRQASLRLSENHQTSEEFLGNEDELGVKVEDKVEVEESEKLELPTTTRSGWTKPVDTISQDLQPEDFAVDEMLLLLDGATAPKSGCKQDNLQTTMNVLRNRLLMKECGKSWNDFNAQGLPNKEALADMHDQMLQTELRSLNRKFVAALRNNLFGLHPRVGNFGTAYSSCIPSCMVSRLTHSYRMMKRRSTPAYGSSSLGGCPLLKRGSPSFVWPPVPKAWERECFWQTSRPSSMPQ